jgi:hypothetical protein
VSKISTDGEILWCRSAGGSASVSGTGIAVDKKGNIYVTGGYIDKPSLGGVPRPAWPTSISVDSRGGAYVGGWFSGRFTFGTASISAEKQGVFVIKVSAAGEPVWAIDASGGTDAVFARGLAVDEEGSIYLSGSFRGRARFGRIELASEGADASSNMFLWKLTQPEP